MICQPRRGSILLVAMWVVIALTGLVLTLSYSMRTEAVAEANRVSQAQAEAAERGMEQLLISVVDQEVATPGSLQDTSLEARQIGDCLTWVIRPDWDNNPQELTYALTDEAGKIDLNTATSAMLLNLPGMEEDLVDCIMDWRDATTSPRSQGAKDDYYLSLPEPYHCKNGPYESVEELLLVKGITRDILFGYDRNRNGLIDQKESQAGGLTSLVNSGSDSGCGIFPFVTVYGTRALPAVTSAINVNADPITLDGQLRSVLGASRAEQLIPLIRQTRPFQNAFDFYFKVRLTTDEFKKLLPRLVANTTATTTTSTAQVGKVNINTAPREVLLCLPSLESSDADAIISHRQSQTSDPTDISWLATTLTHQKAVAIGGLVSGQSLIYSGDVVAISPDGRAFRRYRVVISGKTTPARIIYRRDLTSAGWPLPSEIRAAIRAGQGYQSPLQNSSKGSTAL